MSSLNPKKYDLKSDSEQPEEAVEAAFFDETEELRSFDDLEEIEEEENGEDLQDTMLSDYRADPNLDYYEVDPEDDAEYSELDIKERRALERQMDLRDQEQGRLFEPNDDELFNKKRQRQGRNIDDKPHIIYEKRQANINLSDTRDLPVREFLSLDNVRREIGAQFTLFLTSFVDSNGVNTYGESIVHLCSSNQSSLSVDYQHLCSFDGCGVLAMYLIDAPSEMLQILNEATTQVILKEFEKYDEIHKEVNVRITNLPLEDKLRDLREAHLNTLVKVSGVVTRRTNVLPQLQYVQYECGVCSHILGPFMFDGSTNELKIGSCPSCHSKGSFSINNNQTIYKNFQQISIQETPGSVLPGRLPIQKKVILLLDLVDSCKPGDEIQVTAIYRNNFDISLNKEHGFPIFSTVLEANNVVCTESSPLMLTSADKKLILELGSDPSIGEKIIRSIAPSIHGHENIKEAIALALFGGEPKYGDSNKHRVRGDINVLLCGDPGTGKSQFLKYIEQTAPRCVYTTGKGASAVGLTASVHKDFVTREWVLEGGALVLADRGLCLIDEFDKMSEQDRTSIHEAMEQQSISISKAGIVTSLQARCSVIAACNPRDSNYNPACTFSQNVDLSDPILSRFDIICVVLDKSERTSDMKLAEFIVNCHDIHHPLKRDELETAAIERKETLSSSNVIPQDILKKYIKYAKTNVHPKLTNIDSDKLTKIYQVLRREAMITNSIPITVRHLESMLRISEAHAKMHLREYVDDNDVNIAVRVMLASFISTQKASILNKLKKSLSKYLTFKQHFNDLLAHILNNLFQEQAHYLQGRKGFVPNIIEIPIDDFQTQIRTLQISDLTPFFESNQFQSLGYSVLQNNIRKTYS